jgi:hypothetical protein
MHYAIPSICTFSDGNWSSVCVGWSSVSVSWSGVDGMDSWASSVGWSGVSVSWSSSDLEFNKYSLVEGKFSCNLSL